MIVASLYEPGFRDIPMAELTGMANRTFALILNGASIDLDEVADGLEDRLRHMKVARATRSLEVFSKGWSILLDFVDDEHVGRESVIIANRFGFDRPDRLEIAACRSRIEVSADPDPGMGRFSDYAAALDVLNRMGNIVLFDPKAGQFV